MTLNPKLHYHVETFHWIGKNEDEVKEELDNFLARADIDIYDIQFQQNPYGSHVMVVYVNRSNSS